MPGLVLIGGLSSRLVRLVKFEKEKLFLLKIRKRRVDKAALPSVYEKTGPGDPSGAALLNSGNKAHKAVACSAYQK